MRERRKTARLAESVDFRIGYETYDLSSNTLNLSSNGLLCRVAQAIPLMTKIDMALLIPRAEDNRPPRKIQAKGVVVRVTEDVEGLYKIAVFFTDISTSHRKYLESFIASKLNK